MRSSRTTRKIVGAVSAAAVSVLLLGGAAAATSGDTAGHGLRHGGNYSAGHGLKAASPNYGHGL